jgi:hypothetical protein
MIRAHQPGSQPIDIPEVIPNPAVVPKQEPAPKEPAPKEPVRVPEKVPADRRVIVAYHSKGMMSRSRPYLWDVPLHRGPRPPAVALPNRPP